VEVRVGKFVAKFSATQPLLDDLDVLMLRYIAEKYGGSIPIEELKVAVTLGALAPKWRELLSLPAVQGLIPGELMSAISTNLAERELGGRIDKLVGLGLARRVKEEGVEKVVLTPLGALVGNAGALPLSTPPEVLETTFQSLELLDSVILRPGERLVVESREEVSTKGCTGVVVGLSDVASLGLYIVPVVLPPGFTGRPRLTVVGGQIPVLIRRGDRIAYVVRVCGDEW